MPAFRTPFFGPAYVSRSTNLADARCINVYPEMVETKQGKEVGALYGTPGLDLVGTWGSGPIEDMHEFAATGSIFAVSGVQLYEQTPVFASPTLRGTIGGPGTAWSYTPSTTTFAGIALPFVAPSTSDKVTIVDNGVQLGIFVGISASVQDGFTLINQPGTNLIFQSDLLDLTSWNALNFGEASGHPDNIVALAQIHRETFVIEQTNTEIWINALTPNFSFARVDGTFIEVGCMAEKSVVQVGETLMWLARNLQGQAVVVQCVGYQPKRVSTHMIEREIQSYGIASDAVAYAYQQEGHTFYVISFPTGNATWVYDVTASEQAGIPMWHQRAAFDHTTGQFNRHWSNAYVLLATTGDNLVGDYRNGNIYKFDLSALTDNGTQRKWVRSWRALPQPVEEPVRFNALRIDMQTGIGVSSIPPNDNPQAVLRWSDDGGHNWSNEVFASVGKIGQTASRVQFKRLGSTRNNSGLDRIFELSSSDQFPVAMIGAVLE